MENKDINQISDINIFEELKNENTSKLENTNYSNDAKNKNSSKERLELFKKAINNNEDNFIMQNMQLFEKSPYFSKKIINTWEILFDEWDFDSNLYIVKSWSLSVQKYTDSKKKNTKELAILQVWDFFWEWTLKKNEIKKTSVRSLSITELLQIEWQNDIKKFIKENSEIWIELLFYLIDKTNNRLNETNEQIAINYEIDNTIRELKEINQNTLILLVDKIQELINSDYIVYIEKNSIVKNYYIIKYDSRKSGKFLNILIEAKNWILNLDELYKLANINEKDFLNINKITIWWNDLWFLIIWRESKNFSNNEKIISKSIANSLSWVIKQILIEKEEKDKANLYKSKMTY